LRFRRDFRLFVRCLSDKPTDDGKVPEIEAKDTTAVKKSSENATEKIQELLRSMLAAPTITEKEYAQKFATAPDPRRKNKDVLETKTEKIEESITKAATDVAQAIGGDIKQTEAELLSRVLGKINQTSTIGMKVDRQRDSEEPRPSETRGQQVRRHMERSQSSRPQMSGFRSQTTEPHYGTELDMWDSLKQRELTLATAQPPANYFDKMILWTEQGKIKRTDELRYLGVIVDDLCKWNSHIELLITRVRKLSWVFKKFRHVANYDLILIVYKAVCLSVIQYCISVWGGTHKTYLLPLERAQRRILKVMLFKPFRYPTSQLYNECKLLTVRQTYILQIILRKHKITPYDKTLPSRRTKYKVCSNTLPRTAYVKFQSTYMSNYLYNKINKILNIHELMYSECKLKTTNWLLSLNYDQTEECLEEEQKVHFSEHIFLDAHLEGWCPKVGPIRHFME
ncbi:Mitochondrial ribosomal protein S31, partial [Operophtera brumata]